jgi:hypothetical protein
MTPNLSCDSLFINETFENDLDLRIRQNFHKNIIESVPSLDPIVRFKKRRPQGGKERFKGLDTSDFIFGPNNSVFK